MCNVQFVYCIVDVRKHSLFPEERERPMLHANEHRHAKRPPLPPALTLLHTVWFDTSVRKHARSFYYKQLLHFWHFTHHLGKNWTSTTSTQVPPLPLALTPCTSPACAGKIIVNRRGKQVKWGKSHCSKAAPMLSWLEFWLLSHQVLSGWWLFKNSFPFADWLHSMNGWRWKQWSGFVSLIYKTAYFLVGSGDKCMRSSYVSTFRMLSQSLHLDRMQWLVGFSSEPYENGGLLLHFSVPSAYQ